jgi:hypothetical protein
LCSGRCSCCESFQCRVCCSGLRLRTGYRFLSQIVILFSLFWDGQEVGGPLWCGHSVNDFGAPVLCTLLSAASVLCLVLYAMLVGMRRMCIVSEKLIMRYLLRIGCILSLFVSVMWGRVCARLWSVDCAVCHGFGSCSNLSRPVRAGGVWRVQYIGGWLEESRGLRHTMDIFL